jgi:CubicO group peptidase (beta-lactamase class C family)
MNIIATTALAALINAALPAQEVPVETLNQTIQNSLKFWNIPGCAVSIVQHDHMILAQGYGKKRLGSKDTVDSHTLFPIASLTKPFTAAAIGKLVHHGFCSFDDLVIKFYPGIKLSSLYATGHITLRDCLNMHTGLAGPSISLNYHPDSDLSVQDLFDQQLVTIPFPHDFRGMFSYQNFNYLLAAKVFESTPQKTWDSFLNSQILAPLNMHETLTQFGLFHKFPNKAYPHQLVKGKFVEVPFENLDSLAPCAGMMSTAHDMSLWLRSITTGTLSPTLLLSPQVVATPEGFFTHDQLYLAQTNFPDYQLLTYGFGWFIYDYRGVKVYQTPGLTDGFAPVMAYVPSLGLGIAILPNAESSVFSTALLYQLIDLYLGGTKNDWNQTFSKLFKQHNLDVH